MFWVMDGLKGCGGSAYWRAVSKQLVLAHHWEPLGRSQKNSRCNDASARHTGLPQQAGERGDRKQRGGDWSFSHCDFQSVNTVVWCCLVQRMKEVEEGVRNGTNMMDTSSVATEATHN